MAPYIEVGFVGVFKTGSNQAICMTFSSRVIDSLGLVGLSSNG